MAIALKLKRSFASDKGVVLQQLLHGYDDGHRLIDGSITVPDELTRLVLRLSDLSGSNVTNGFEEYITGYPLQSLHAYALAKTWYAPEMPRPGCVWTHTIIIPSPAMSEIISLDRLVRLFKRPNSDTSKGSYAEPFVLKHSNDPDVTLPVQKELMSTLVLHYYGKESVPVVLPSRSSAEFECLIFALWSQMWPSLRMGFTFCTGALSARFFNKRPFDVQCVPASRSREIVLDSTANGGVSPVTVNLDSSDYPAWVAPAAVDAVDRQGGRLREFLWAVSNDSSERNDFGRFVTVLLALEADARIGDLISLVIKLFPGQLTGRQLKRVLFGKRDSDNRLPYEEQDVLLALATTSEYEHFDGEELVVRERGEALSRFNPDAASWLVGELAMSTLNPMGEKILAGILSASDAITAGRFVGKHAEVLPALFRVKPSLASSPQMWVAAGDRKLELIEAIAAHGNLDPTQFCEIIDALIKSGSEVYLGRALDRWGKVAILGALDRVEANGGVIAPALQEALRSHLSLVIEWIEANPNRSFKSLLSLAHVVAPFPLDLARRDISLWVSLLNHLKNTGNEAEETYICAFLLALALVNAPPAPLDLVSESFERVHEAARKNALSDSAWNILEPHVPELSWFSNWDKCERLRRGLVSAFVRYGWPPVELRRRIRDSDLVRELIKSAKWVNGGVELARKASLSNEAI